MQVRKTKFTGPWPKICLMFMAIGLIDIIQGLIQFCSLGTVVIRDDDYYGLLSWGEALMKGAKKNFLANIDNHKKMCDCPGCRFREETGKPLTDQNLKAVIDEFQDRNAPIQELQDWLNKVGIEVNIMELPIGPTQQPSKEDTYH